MDVIENSEIETFNVIHLPSTYEIETLRFFLLCLFVSMVGYKQVAYLKLSCYPQLKSV